MTKSIPWASRSEAVTRQTASLPILHYDFGVNFPIHTRNTCQILQHSNIFPTPSVSIWNCWINRKCKLVTLSLLFYTMSFMTLQGLSDIICNFVDVTLATLVQSVEKLWLMIKDAMVTKGFDINCERCWHCLAHCFI